NGKKVKRTRLLKRLFDVIACLVPKSEGGPANQPDHVRRVFDVAGKDALHPFPRTRRRAQQRKSAARSENPAIFRIAHDEKIFDVASRQVCTHIEFAGITRRFNRLQRSEKRKLIAHAWPAAPTNKNGRIPPNLLLIDFRAVQFQQKRGVTVRFHLWLCRDRASHIRWPGLWARDLRERVRGRVSHARAMQHKKRRADDSKDQRRKFPPPSGKRAGNWN